MHQLIDKKNKIVIYLIFLFILSTISNKNINSPKNFSIMINKINVEGLSNKNNLQIASNLKNLFYKNIFFINKKEINQIISDNNIIEEYSIQKIYPSKLNIDIKPTKFIAKIYSNNELLVGSNGKLITSKTHDKILPEINGKFNVKEFLKFKKSIDQSKFNFLELKSIFFHPLNRWDILTVNDILIKLPKDNLLKSLKLAHKIIDDNQFEDKKIIDLRLANYIIIR
tara:strand:- start:1667 stop:2344 length:678 start_codon:yes stop_codon:yes gene_type:complete